MLYLNLLDYSEDDLTTSLTIFFTHKEVMKVWSYSKDYNVVVMEEISIDNAPRRRIDGKASVERRLIGTQMDGSLSNSVVKRILLSYSAPITVGNRLVTSTFMSFFGFYFRS